MSNFATREDVKKMARILTRRMTILFAFASIVIAFMLLYR